jgi:hypothetical protein
LRLPAIFLWGEKTRCTLIATPNEDNANRRQKKGKSPLGSANMVAKKEERKKRKKREKGKMTGR